LAIKVAFENASPSLGQEPSRIADGRSPTLKEAAFKLTALSPVLAALLYPYLLMWFHEMVEGPERLSPVSAAVAAVCLLGALLVPFLGLAAAWRISRVGRSSEFSRRARRLAYASMSAPPLYVFTGVTLGLLGSTSSEGAVWTVGWLVALIFGWRARDVIIETQVPPKARWRVAHGVSALLIAAFVIFHLSNHLGALLGSDLHGKMMETGRTLYRATWIEPLFIGFLLFQVASGLHLAWHWSAVSANFFRVVQVGSGAYVAVFILTHLNSALISARLVRNLETDWAWASGSPDGLLLDAWNIRLLPHYALGVFFILFHLATGARHILRAHGLKLAVVNRIWILGVAFCVAISAAIVGALLGVRI
jgi:hypothetical protein